MKISAIALIGISVTLFCNMCLTVFLLNQNSHRLDQMTELSKMIGQLANNQKTQTDALIEIMRTRKTS